MVCALKGTWGVHPAADCVIYLLTFSVKFEQAHMPFFFLPVLTSFVILYINAWAPARKITVFSCLCQWAAHWQLLKGSSKQADGCGRSVSHSTSVLSADWDPADQRHGQITLNKLSGESWHLVVCFFFLERIMMEDKLSKKEDTS